MEKNLLEKEKVSVIIPVYKVEAYIRECLDSVIQQTYKNLEIILVFLPGKSERRNCCVGHFSAAGWRTDAKLLFPGARNGHCTVAIAGAAILCAAGCRIACIFIGTIMDVCSAVQISEFGRPDIEECSAHKHRKALENDRDDSAWVIAAGSSTGQYEAFGDSADMRLRSDGIFAGQCL